MPDETIGVPGRDTRTTLPIEPRSEESATIANYRILQKIGEGGMGEVYLAEQIRPIQRRVAIKIIKPGMDSREVLARFAAEQQAIAMMNHPNIARAYEAGSTEEGRPYFVMEYVAGEPITEYCDRHRLGTRDRLQLFARVCDGVQHAHQKAIIHRDLKPHNVLVTLIDDQPVPKIIDFGVAKAIGSSLSDETVYTRLGQLIGTPEYMSPEQMEMSSDNIDTRTDIYSLGVILYELITGAPPFDVEDFRKDGFDAIRRRIREVDPPKPSTRVGRGDPDSDLSAQNRHSEPSRLASELKGDLDWITLKALEKDRARRYPTANALAQDIQRYLQHEPVLASPPSAVYRLSKLVQRHRGAFVALAAIFVVLVATSAISTALFFRAQRESKRAREEAARSEQVAKFMRDMLAGAGPSVAMGRDTKLLREILENTSKRLDRELSGQPRVEAQLRSMLAETYADLGEFPASKANADRSLALFTKELGPDAEETLDQVEVQATLAYRLGDMGAAESLNVYLRDHAARHLGPHHVLTLLANSGLASVYNYSTQNEKADSLGTPALAGLRRTLGDHDPQTLSTMMTMAQVYTDQRRFDVAESTFTTLIRLLRDQYGPDYPELLSAKVSLGWMYRLAGRKQDAERETSEGLAAERRVLGSDHAETMVAINNLAIIEKDLGNFAKAEPLYLENVERSFKVQGPKHPEAITSVVNLASFFYERGRYRDAEARADQAVRLFEGVVPDDFPGKSIARQIRGLSRWKLGRDADAEKDLLAAEKVLVPIFGPEHRRVKELYAGLAEVETKLGKSAEATKYRTLIAADAASGVPAAK